LTPILLSLSHITTHSSLQNPFCHIPLTISLIKNFKMVEPTLETRIAAAAKFSALAREGIDKEASQGNNNTLCETIDSMIHTTTARCTIDYFPPQVLDYELHTLWYVFFVAAQNFEVENPKQDTLIRQMLQIRELGALKEKATNSSAVASNGAKIWSDLPYLVEDLQKYWREESFKITTEQRTNLASFIARLVAVGVGADGLTELFVTLMRDTLETPRRLSREDEGEGISVEELLPAVQVWLRFAARKLGSVSETKIPGGSVAVQLGSLAKSKGPKGVEEGGFSASRWAFWKERLQELNKEGKGGGAKQVDVIWRLVKVDHEGNTMVPLL
jgi:hypothetical protein